MRHSKAVAFLVLALFVPFTCTGCQAIMSLIGGLFGSDGGGDMGGGFDSGGGSDWGGADLAGGGGMDSDASGNWNEDTPASLAYVGPGDPARSTSLRSRQREDLSDYQSNRDACACFGCKSGSGKCTCSGPGGCDNCKNCNCGS